MAELNSSATDCKTIVAIQASLISWEGGKDLCANIWGGKLVVEHTLERVRCDFADLPVWIVAPDIAENWPLKDIARNYEANVVFGSFNDVVKRFCLLPKEVCNILRIVGQV